MKNTTLSTGMVAVLSGSLGIGIGLLIALGVHDYHPTTTTTTTAGPAETVTPTSTFIRQPDGGTFPNYWSLHLTLTNQGVDCTDPTEGTHPLAGKILQCWTGIGNVYLVVREDGSDPRQSWYGTWHSAVFGQNWVLFTDEDPDFAATVKNAIGGEVYTR
jgi:hypothetical protein